MKVISVCLRWSTTCVITISKGVGTFAITETKLYVLVAMKMASVAMKIKKYLKKKNQ